MEVCYLLRHVDYIYHSKFLMNHKFWVYMRGGKGIILPNFNKTCDSKTEKKKEL